MGVHWKDWCWSWNSSTLSTWYEELTHLKRPWCWEGLRAGGEGDDGGWDGWMASPTQQTWVWVDSRSWWWTGRPGVLQFMGLQRVKHDWATELNWTDHSHGIPSSWSLFSHLHLTPMENSPSEPPSPSPLPSSYFSWARIWREGRESMIVTYPFQWALIIYQTLHRYFVPWLHQITHNHSYFTDVETNSEVLTRILSHATRKRANRG